MKAAAPLGIPAFFFFRLNRDFLSSKLRYLLIAYVLSIARHLNGKWRPGVNSFLDQCLSASSSRWLDDFRGSVHFDHGNTHSFVHLPNLIS